MRNYIYGYISACTV